MSELDPERFTLRQAAQARDDFAQIMDELEFVKGAVGSASNAQGSSVYPASHNVWVGSPQRRARHPLVGNVLAALPLSAPS
jgi:hypothetical protein